MKKILIVCGSGYATSFAMKNRLEKLLADKHYLEECEIICTDIKSFDNCLFEPDMIIQLAHKFREKYSGIPMFNGIPFLTGVGLAKKSYIKLGDSYATKLSAAIQKKTHWFLHCIGNFNT